MRHFISLQSSVLLIRLYSSVCCFSLSVSSNDMSARFSRLYRQS